MVNANANAMGIIFPNSYDSLVPELVTERLMASIPFAGRYRLIDFVLSSMVNSGIDNISFLVRKNYHSLMDHLGSGRSWDLIRKNGGLNIIPPYAEKSVTNYSGRVEMLAGILGFLRGQREKYVIMSDANIAVNFDFKDFLNQHIASGADVTMAYARQEIPAGLIKPNDVGREMYYTIDVDETGRVNRFRICPDNGGMVNLSMNIYCIEREFLIEHIRHAYVEGNVYFERDVLSRHLDDVNIRTYEFTGYQARISSMKSYFDENMKLLDENNLDALFSGNPIYTKVRDDNPTRYMAGATAENVLVADGCVIEGDIENSVLFRGVKVGKGARVRNCVLMQDTVIEDGADIEYIVSDKNATITKGKWLRGSDSFPVFVAKSQVV